MPKRSRVAAKPLWEFVDCNDSIPEVRWFVFDEPGPSAMKWLLDVASKNSDRFSLEKVQEFDRDVAERWILHWKKSRWVGGLDIRIELIELDEHELVYSDQKAFDGNLLHFDMNSYVKIYMDDGDVRFQPISTISKCQSLFSGLDSEDLEVMHCEGEDSPRLCLVVDGYAQNKGKKRNTLVEEHYPDTVNRQTFNGTDIVGVYGDVVVAPAEFIDKVM